MFQCSGPLQKPPKKVQIVAGKHDGQSEMKMISLEIVEPSISLPHAMMSV